MQVVKDVKFLIEYDELNIGDFVYGCGCVAPFLKDGSSGYVIHIEDDSVYFTQCSVPEVFKGKKPRLHIDHPEFKFYQRHISRVRK